MRGAQFRTPAAEAALFCRHSVTAEACLAARLPARQAGGRAGQAGRAPQTIPGFYTHYYSEDMNTK
jgi:hypothetical protein